MREKKQNWYVNRRKYHFIYKTTCKVNSKYYLGMHSTDSLDDGYIGSGTYLAKSIRKYGRENFSIEILEFLPDRESLRQRESEVINEEKLIDPLCMNLTLGGYGEFPLQCAKAGGKTNAGNKRKTGNYGWKVRADTSSPEHQAKVSAGLKARFKEFGHPWTGKKHSPETCAKLREAKIGHGVGEKNSQAGTCWIVKVHPMKIKLAELDSYLAQGWIRGRIIPH